MCTNIFVKKSCTVLAVSTKVCVYVFTQKSVLLSKIIIIKNMGYQISFFTITPLMDIYNIHKLLETEV